MKFSEDFIEKVSAANDIVDIIGRHTQLKRGSRSMMALCPFPDHQEKSPSFSVSPDKQLYHCFGCGKSGNIFTFLKDYYGYSFPEAVEFLAKRAGMELPKDQNFRPEQREKREELKKALSEALRFYRKQLALLPQDHPAKKYLERRQMGEEKVIQNLQLGWAPDEWSSLTDYLQSKGVSLACAEELGLIKSKKTKGSYFDLFRNRVMFPVFSFSGEVLGFGGRVLGDEKPKYLNSPESVLFKKSRIFYGQNWASPYIRQKDEAVLVEGYTDWISLFLNQIPNVLATMGTALTEDHARSLKRSCSKVVCLFDGDEAGARASERALKNIISHGILVRAVFLPQGEDPDSYIKKMGSEALQKEILEAEDLFLKILDRKMKDYKGQTYQKTELMDWALDILARLDPSSSLLPVYFQEMELRLKISHTLLREALAKKLRKANEDSRSSFQRGIQSERTAGASNGPASKASGGAAPVEQLKKVDLKVKKTDTEYILFSLALEQEELQEELQKEDFSFFNPNIQYLWSLACRRNGQGLENSVSLEAYLARYLERPEALTLTLERPYCQLSKEQKKEIFKDCLHKIHKKRLTAQAKSLSKNLGQDADEKELEKFMELQRQRMMK